MHDSELKTAPLWPIYIISLRTALKRRARCVETMMHLGLSFEFFDAVDGTRLSTGEIAQIYDSDSNGRDYKHPLSRPEIGCALSHFELWQRISSGKVEGAFILEDDFQAEPGFAELLSWISRTGVRNCMIKLFSSRPVNGQEICPLPGGHRLLMPRRVPGYLVGYAIDCEAATKLAANTMPFSRPIDIGSKHWWESDVPVLVVQPSPLRIDDKVTGSSIEAARSVSKTGGNASIVGRALGNLRYQVDYNAEVIRHRHRQRAHLVRLAAALRDESEQ